METNNRMSIVLNVYLCEHKKELVEGIEGDGTILTVPTNEKGVHKKYISFNMRDAEKIICNLLGIEIKYDK